MRAITAFILCFVLAFQGIASARVLQQPCPMDHGQNTVMAGHDMADAGDCCNDADTVSKTGQLCKTNVPCSSTSAAVVTASVAALPAPLAPGYVLTQQALHASFDLAVVWRPPTIS